VSDAASAREIRPGQSIRARTAGQQHTFGIRLEPGQSVRVLVDQHDADLALQVRAPDGDALWGVDARERGVESATIVAAESGVFTIDVRMPNPPIGTDTPYDVRIETPPHPVTARDRLRQQAESLVSEGRRLASDASTGQRQTALDRLRAALPLWRQIDDAAAEAATLAKIGDVRHKRGEFEDAKAAYLQSLTLSEQIGDRRQIGELLNNIGVSDWRRGLLTDAMHSLDRALEEWRSLPLPAGEAATLVNQGNLFFESGDYQEALERYLSALKIFQQRADAKSEAYALNNIGVTYRALGDFDTARRYLSLSLPRFRAAGEVRGEGRALVRLSQIQLARGDVKEATASAENALAVIRRAADPVAEADVFDLFGQIASKASDPQKALADHTQALARYRASGSRLGEATALHNLGTVLGSLGDTAQARDVLTDTLRIRHDAGLRDAEAATLHQIALVEWRAGNLLQAASRLRSALALAEDVRGRVAEGYSRTTYFAAHQEYFATYLELLMQLHARDRSGMFAREAFDTAERMRARTLLDVLEESPADVRQSVDPALLRRERSQRHELNFWSYRLAALADTKGAKDEAARVTARIGDLLAEYRETQGRIRAARSRDAALTSPPPLTVQVVQREVLDPDTLLLRFFLGERRSYVWLITRRSLRVVALPAKAEIDRAAYRVYELVSRKRLPSNGRELLEGYERAAQQLSTMMLDPIAPYLRGQRLLVISEGALQLVPFAALPAPGTGAPLIATHEIVMLPSASTLAALRRQSGRRAPASKALAVLADPVYESNDPRVARRVSNGSASPDAPSMARLPFSRFEGSTILGLVPPAQSHAAFGFDASREAVIGPGLLDYRIVHIAAHAIADPAHPELSGIVLSLVDPSGAPRDGVLRLHDIVDTVKLRADLVVLSACQTAVGQDVPGEGVMGLARGFFAAGTTRVVASLYKVEDEATAELMRAFYEAMLGRARLSPAAALRVAQMKMHAQPRWRDPYWWSAFVLMGEPR
jgi:CHAT domain-containing protein/tetratricopeptide (TPR) repeat protein